MLLQFMLDFLIITLGHTLPPLPLSPPPPPPHACPAPAPALAHAYTDACTDTAKSPRMDFTAVPMWLQCTRGLFLMTIHPNQVLKKRTSHFMQKKKLLNFLL